jgi:hypothetical protein
LGLGHAACKPPLVLRMRLPARQRLPPSQRDASPPPPCNPPPPPPQTCAALRDGVSGEQAAAIKARGPPPASPKEAYPLVPDACCL